MSSMMRPKIVLYGHSFCPQVHMIRAALDQIGVLYDYIDIRKDDAGRKRVREINAGYESVPTLVFPDGSTLTEPSEDALYAQLLASGYRLDPLTLRQRIMVYLGNPMIGAFGTGVLIIGGIASVLPVIGVGAFLILLPLLVRILPKLSSKAS